MKELTLSREGYVALDAYDLAATRYYGEFSLTNANGAAA
jgi:hypothetical protein